MMTVAIEDFSFESIIGIVKEERNTPQKVLINVYIDYELQKSSFLDYMKICKEIKKEFQTKKFRLLEDAAVSICNSLKSKNQSITKIKIHISKPQIRQDAKVGIVFEKNFS